MVTVLVTGGCGYLGSYIVKMLSDRGYMVVALDNMSRGSFLHPKGSNLIYETVDLLDESQVLNVFKKIPIDVVIHLAAYAYVEESTRLPSLYFEQNLISTTNIAEIARRHRVTKLIYASSMAVYGDARSVVTEEHSTKPMNPYGLSKLFSEKYLELLAKDSDLDIKILRLPNLVGVDLQNPIDESHDPETHLIPNLLNASASLKTSSKEDSKFVLYGHPEAELDGTCIRDYLHISDVYSGIEKILKSTKVGQKYDVFNLSTNLPHSTYQVLKIVEEVTGVSITREWAKVRIGDPPYLFGDSSKFRDLHNWRPEHSDLRHVIMDLWAYKSNKMNT